MKPTALLLITIFLAGCGDNQATKPMQNKHVIAVLPSPEELEKIDHAKWCPAPHIIDETDQTKLKEKIRQIRLENGIDAN